MNYEIENSKRMLKSALSYLQNGMKNESSSKEALKYIQKAMALLNDVKEVKNHNVPQTIKPNSNINISLLDKMIEEQRKKINEIENKKPLENFNDLLNG